MRQCDSCRRRDVRELFRPAGSQIGIGIGTRTPPGVTTLPRRGRHDTVVTVTDHASRGYRRAA